MRSILRLAALVLALLVAAPAAAAAEPGALTGIVVDRQTGEPVSGVCAVAYPFGSTGAVAAAAVTDEDGRYAVEVEAGAYQVAFFDCAGWDYAGGWHGDGGIDPVVVAAEEAVAADGALTGADLPGLVDVRTGRWHLAAPRNELVGSFYFGNPGDLPMVGDWDCDGIDTPGLYRQADGYVYLRNSNTQGIADVRFYFGDPGDVPLAGDFDGDGCDTVSVYRPAEARVYVINELGSGEAGLGAAETSYSFGESGDEPFVGDFDGDGVDTVGLFRPATATVFLRNGHAPGAGDVELSFGGRGDAVLAGDFTGLGVDEPATYTTLDRVFTMAGRTEAWEFAGYDWHPVAGVFGR